MPDTTAPPTGAPRSTPQTPTRKMLPDGDEYDHAMITNVVTAALPPDQVVVYAVIDAWCKGYNREMSTHDIMAALPLLSGPRILAAMKALWQQGYITRRKGSAGGMWHCYIIFNPTRFPKRWRPEPKVATPPPKRAYRRVNRSPVDDDGELLDDRRPVCVGVTKDGRGPQCRAHATATSDMCIAHHNKRTREVEITAQVPVPPAVESVPMETRIPTHDSGPPAVDSTAQSLVLEAAERKEAVADDRAGALPYSSSTRTAPGTQQVHEHELSGDGAGHGTDTLVCEFPDDVDTVADALASAEGYIRCGSCGVMALPGNWSCDCNGKF